MCSTHHCWQPIDSRCSIRLAAPRRPSVALACSDSCCPSAAHSRGRLRRVRHRRNTYLSEPASCPIVLLAKMVPQSDKTRQKNAPVALAVTTKRCDDAQRHDTRTLPERSIVHRYPGACAQAGGVIGSRRAWKAGHVACVMYSDQHRRHKTFALCKIFYYYLLLSGQLLTCDQ